MEDAVYSLKAVSGHSQSNCCLYLQSRQDDVDRTVIHIVMVERLVSIFSVDLATPNSAVTNIYSCFNFTKV